MIVAPFFPVLHINLDLQESKTIAFTIEYLGGNVRKWRVKMTAHNPRKNKTMTEHMFLSNDYAKVLRTTGKKVTEVAESVGAEIIDNGFNSNYFFFQSVDHAKQFIDGLSKWLVPLRLQGYQVKTTINSYGYQE